MKSYLVTWTIDIDAGNPREAARIALAIQRKPKSTAVVFEVTEHDTADTLTIDLDEATNQ